VKRFYIESGAQRWLDIYRWVAGLAVTWHWTVRFTLFFPNRKKLSAQLLRHFIPHRMHRGLY
jgi:hypothetical protein